MNDKKSLSKIASSAYAKALAPLQAYQQYTQTIEKTVSEINEALAPNKDDSPFLIISKQTVGTDNQSPNDIRGRTILEFPANRHAFIDFDFTQTSTKIEFTPGMMSPPLDSASYARLEKNQALGQQLETISEMLAELAGKEKALDEKNKALSAKGQAEKPSVLPHNCRPA